MKAVPNCHALRCDADDMLCFLGTISNVSPWSLQTISWFPLLMEGGSTVFSKVTCYCSAVLAPTLPTEGSAPAGTISRGRLHSARTAYSSSRAAPSWAQPESFGEEILSTPCTLVQVLHCRQSYHCWAELSTKRGGIHNKTAVTDLFFL